MNRETFLNHINSLSHKHLVLALKWANGGYTKGLGDYMKYSFVDVATGETIKGKAALQYRVALMLQDNGQGFIQQKYGDGLSYSDAMGAITAFIMAEEGKVEATSDESKASKEERETESVPETSTTDTAQKLTALFSEMLQNQSKPLDESAIAKIVQREINNSLLNVAKEAAEKAARELVPLKVIIESKGETKPVDGLVHHTFPTLLKMLSAKVNVWLVGPAGSGKTTAVEQASQALGRQFYFNGAIDTEYKLLGFTDAMGRVVCPQFRKAYESGGVYLFDEIDGSGAGALLALNAALANGYCDFPDGMIKRHPDFVAVAAANTFGMGATSDYVGRAKLDGATLDRFVFLSWDYDQKLELQLSGNPEWCVYVQTLRARARHKGVKVIISPRASINGARLLEAGLDRDTVINSCVRKGMTEEQWLSLQTS